MAVLHVALNPITGVWSVMRELAKAQLQSGRYAAVGTGIISDESWPALCKEELQSGGLPYYLSGTPKVFGTAQFLLQRIHPPPLEKWVRDFLSKSGAERCILHFHNAWLSGVFVPLGKEIKDRAKVVATFHGVNAHFPGQPVRKRLHQWMAARLKKHKTTLTSVDKANLTRAQDLLGLSPTLFRIVPNGVTDTPKRACPSLQGSRILTLGHVGSMMEAKGWRMLVEAVRQIRPQGHGIRVVLAGRGADAGEAEKLANESGGWLVFKGFVANPREVLMPELDALVLMSEQEGLPMAIIEALSLGLPVIATPVGGVPEAVAHGKNGFLVDRSVQALAGAIGNLKDLTQLRSLSAEARLVFEQRFEISRIVSRYNDIYQEET